MHVYPNVTLRVGDAKQPASTQIRSSQSLNLVKPKRSERSTSTAAVALRLISSLSVIYVVSTVPTL